MVRRISNDGRPLMERSSSSNESFGVLGSRISSVSDFSDPSSPPDYDPHIRKTKTQDFVSPQSSYGDLYSHMTESPREDIDVSHVRLSSSSPIERLGSATSRLPPSLRTGTPISPASNRSRFSWGPVYDTLSPIDGPASSNSGIADRMRSMRSNAGRRLSRHMSIPEEDAMDLGLVTNASGFSHGGTAYGIAEEHEMEEIGFAVDISSFTGPMNSRDEATVKEYRRLESAGQLTGGLGAGFTPEVTIKSKDLLSPTTTTDFGRRLSRTGSVLGRTSTIRDLAQREANRRGKIVEIIDETPDQLAHADIGYFGGDSVPVEFDPQANRHSTFSPQKKTYYPQPDWKPVSMRYPYLTALVMVSIALAAGQELLLQRSLKMKGQNTGLFHFDSPQEMPTWDYFSYKYLPTIIAVSYGILWQIADYEIKRVEPYYQLSKEGGALAAESINVDYITIFNIFRPFMAIRYKHYAVAVSSIATLFAVSLVPTLQGPTIILEPDRQTRLDHPHGTKFINISPVWSRVLTVILAIISSLGLVLLYQLQSRRSGLVGDVQGIAGIAAMATKSHVLMDFKDLDTVPPQDIHNKLKNHRYALRNSSLAPEEATLTPADKYKYDQYHLSPNPHPLMMRLVAGIPLIVSLILFLALIPSLLFIPAANIILDKVPWLLTAIAVAIKISFQTLEQDVRMMEPFFRLSCRHAPPKVLTLDYTGMAFGWMPIRAFMNKDYLVCLVGLGSVLAEILTVCVTSFAGVTGSDFLPPGPNENGGPRPAPRPDTTNAGEETLASFWVSLCLSMAILTYLIIVASATYHLRRHPFLPRQPSTIASVLAFVHQSNMLYDFVDTPRDHASGDTSIVSRDDSIDASTKKSSFVNSSGRNNSSSSLPTVYSGKSRYRLGSVLGSNEADQSVLVARLEQMGKTYGLGWFTGRDGETHCGVDQEELRGDYKHSAKEDARKASKPWLGNWEYL